jgi:putative glutamine amidotransferase
MKTYVVDQTDYGYLAEALGKNGFIKAKSYKEADLIWFTGGSDIEPKWYNEKPIQHGYNSWVAPSRDRFEFALLKEAVADGKFVFGVCRGLQLLNIFNGGSLYQDVSNHMGHHDVRDFKTGKSISVNSVHHQACRPGKDAVVVCGNALSSKKRSQSLEWSRLIRTPLPDTFQEGHDVDIEGLWYPKTKCLGLQSHPEYDDATNTTNYAFELLNRYGAR